VQYNYEEDVHNVPPQLPTHCRARQCQAADRLRRRPLRAERLFQIRSWDPKNSRKRNRFGFSGFVRRGATRCRGHRRSHCSIIPTTRPAIDTFEAASTRISYDDQPTATGHHAAARASLGIKHPELLRHIFSFSHGNTSSPRSIRRSAIRFANFHGMLLGLGHSAESESFQMVVAPFTIVRNWLEHLNSTGSRSGV
jgi:hypothetical protein